MDHNRLIDQLPDMLAVAVRLDDAGHPAETIGCALGIPVQSVRNLLVVAHCKLDHLAADEPTGSTSRSSSAAGLDTV
ncbi:hypothetical protein [Flexivirga oryzae]|uniref:RNA polymerase sigma factor 70 region 4 type 2 domain-containing protein n=1 Tax=Flexivirga oryzae TaxID=1794944 RepID=A0A839N0U3_9MICO|nr:hypothetical protein [Flexivirga oryzae]MBB2890439.1 hypothetical protein [Flexivirga oryzae]